MQKLIIVWFEIQFSNSMIEVNKPMKYDFLLTLNYSNLELTEQYLKLALKVYPNQSHNSLYELLQKGDAAKKNMFQPGIKSSLKKKREINKNQVCLNCF